MINNNPPLFSDETDADAPLFDSKSARHIQEQISNTSPKWKICIVDDEQSVHDVTLIALKRFVFQQKDLEFIHAYSAAEGKKIIAEHCDIAVILLDVVMEEDNSGLKLVEYIRENLHNTLSRIILRTGQPGVAPPQMVINDYDINDYKDKTELTVQKLNSCIVTALRSYRDLIALHDHREGLKQVISSTAFIHSQRNLSKFVSGLLVQILAVLRSCEEHHDTVVSGFISCDNNVDINKLRINNGTASFENKTGNLVSQSLSQQSIENIRLTFENKKSGYFDNETVFLFDKGSDQKGIIYIDRALSDNDVHAGLIELFCSNIPIAFDNLILHKELEETQTEIIFTLGNISEFRSKETSQHVKRVALYSELIALKMGLSDKEVAIIKAASPLHDIGKIGIADSILHKPCSLTNEEFTTMMSHAQLGFDMLKSSNRPILKAAAIIAHQHQEKFNGSGYPQSLAGRNIHVYGRIVALADVFDALSNDRCYKKAWPLEDVFEYIEKQKGQHFDPEIASYFLNSREEVSLIYTQNQEQNQPVFFHKS